MNAWRALLAVSFLLLSGCLVTFKDPIPANEAAPIPLLGEWSRKNEWGEQLYLQITRAGSNVYKARAYVDSLDNLDDLPPPEVLQQEIIEHLEAALAACRDVAAALPQG